MASSVAGTFVSPAADVELPEQGTGAVLVVDDDSSNLLAIEAAFADTDHELVKARSGREALRMLLERDFALILLDVEMPGMDGFETAQLIRSRGRTRHVPIIFITAYSRDDQGVLQGYALGAVDFLFKPVVPEVLRAKVQVFVDLRRQTERVRELERRAQAQRLAEERQRWEADALREEMDRKDEFLAILAHELRNPLAPIVTSLQILKQQDLEDPLLVRTRDAMDRQVKHLARLVDDLLDISRISSGKITLRPEPLDLVEVVDQAVEAVASALRERGHDLELEVPEEPLAISADRDRLAQIIANLLGNAARYTEPGGRISLACEARGDQVTVRVRDNGRGIPPEVLPHIFGLFVQEQGSGQGLGLGLALVKRLVELHDGEVAAESAGSGKGSTFTVRLPRLQPRAEIPRLVAEPADVPGESLRVLLIDDEPDVRETTSVLLECWGHRVDVARCGEEGIELVESVQPEVVFVDLGMPDIDGCAVARAVCARLARPPYLVAITGYGAPRDRARTREAGFDEHLLKPVSAEQLRSALARAASRRNPSAD